MTLKEIKDKINQEFANVISHPDLDFIDRIHARSVRNWALIAAPKIAEHLAASPVIVGADASATATPSATGFMTVVFDALKLVFAANPLILAIIVGVEGIVHLVSNLLGGQA